jgi:hypothetical protein
VVLESHRKRHGGTGRLEGQKAAVTGPVDDAAAGLRRKRCRASSRAFVQQCARLLDAKRCAGALEVGAAQGLSPTAHGAAVAFTAIRL